jgi:Acyl-CoA synthetases (AMP-forming)/AMP-acid ligases II
MTSFNLGEWLLWHERLTPDKVGLIDGDTGTCFTYRTLQRRAYALACYFQQTLQISQGERVAVLACNAPEYLDTLFACALLGAVMVPLNWRLTPYELTMILKDCEPKLLVHDLAYTECAQALAREFGPTPSLQLCSFAHFPGEQITQITLKPFETRDGEEPIVILYTSGTTGLPKGVILSHRMITWNAINTQMSWHLYTTDITPTFAPFFHAGGLNVLTTPLYYLGGTVVLLRNADPRSIFTAIEKQRCTIVFAVPTIFQRMLEDPNFTSTDFTTLRFCVAGGSSCPTALIQGYAARGVDFRQGYGLTEAGVNCFSLAPEDAFRKIGSVGTPIVHTHARIVNSDDSEVAPGEVGELTLAGPHLCSGYWRRPEATTEASRGGWWHTGDLVRRDDEGYYYIVGRKKDMYISGGENIYPAEVENVIATHPAVLEVAVIPQPDPRWGEVGLAVVVPRVPGAVSAQDILDYCASKIARYKLPRSVHFVTALPRNIMGKVMKAALVKEFQHNL